MNKEDNIGRKVKGFKFKSNNRISYTSEMHKFIGVEGTITEVVPKYNSYRIKFPNDSYNYHYPIPEVEKRLALEIPEIGVGIPMYVGNKESDRQSKHKRYVVGTKNGNYLAWVNSGTEKSAIASSGTTTWNYAWPIQEEEKEVHLTLEDISAGKGKGVPAHLIRIKK
jgi:hypothetical protein